VEAVQRSRRKIPEAFAGDEPKKGRANAGDFAPAGNTKHLQFSSNRAIMDTQATAKTKKNAISQIVEIQAKRKNTQAKRCFFRRIFCDSLCVVFRNHPALARKYADTLRTCNH